MPPLLRETGAMRAIRRLAIVAALAAVPGPVGSMQFETLRLQGGGYAIIGAGPINIGDDARLHQMVGTLPANTELVAVGLNSAGGSVVEAGRLAATIRASGLPTIVVDGHTCVSACFLLFAAGTDRAAGEGARIGVHSASDAGRDTFMAQAITTAMAREAATYGVPANIIGRMVTARPDEMAWLSPGELRQMGVTILPSERGSAAAGGYQPGSALIPGRAALAPLGPSPAQPAPSAPAASPQAAALPSAVSPAAQPEVSAGFRDGRRDRTAWEQWFGGLAGDAREGALWWSSVRSQAARNRITCSSSANATPGFTQGCAAAANLLAPFDRRRLSEPEYRAGWNSY